MENIRLAFQGIWSHKLRSFLTMLGIIIGIASIITIVSTIKGTNEQIKQNLIGAGNDVVTVQLYQSNYVYDMTWNGLPSGVRPIAESSRAELEALSGVEQVSFFRSRSNSSGVAYYGSQEFTGNICGVDRAYFGVKGYQLVKGRGFLDSDFDTSRKVAILDNIAASSLFGDEEPVGKVLELKGYAFTVVGVVAQMKTFTPNIESYSDYHLYVETSGGSVFIPDAAWPILYQFDEPQSVAVKAESTDAMTRAGKNVADFLTANQIMTSGTVIAEGDGAGEESSGFSYRSEDLLEQAQQLQEMSSSTNQQLIWIASISLLVGGIGVMNIMLVSVTERTSEIGLKKALGAKRRRILLQFLTEASVLTCLGGLVGVLSGVGLAELLSRWGEIPVSISVPAILVAVLFSTLIGLIFGLLPAVKAARLNPIEALRRD
ncbi:MAG: ABC transporter permease [Faecousia sp.]